MANSRTFVDAELLTAALINTHLVHQVPVTGDAYDTGWIDTGLTWATDYESYGSPGVANVAEYRRIGMEVHFRGLVRRLNTDYSSTTASTMFTLPTAFRPSRNVIALGMSNAGWNTGTQTAGTAHTHPIFAGGAAGPTMRVTVNSNGTVQVSMGGAVTLAVNNWVSIGAISYLLD